MALNDLYISPRKKHYGWRYLACLLSGLFLGVGGTVGGIVYATTCVSTGQLISAFGQDPNTIVKEKYQNESLFTFALSMASGDIDFTSIKGLDNLTPFVGELTDTLSSTFNKYLGVTFTTDEILVLDLEQVPDFLFTKVKKEAKIAVILDINENSDPLLQLLAFHKNEDGTFNYDDPRPLSEFSGDNSGEGGDSTGGIFDEIISDAKVEDVLDIQEGDFLYNFKDCKVSELEETIKNTPLNQLITITEDDSAILRFLATYTFNNISEGIAKMSVSDVFGDQIDNLNPIIKALFDCRILDLGTEINSLPLSSFIDSNKDIPFALRSVLNKTKIDPETGEERPYYISEITECYENLVIGDIIDYSSDAIKNNKFIKYIPENTRIEDIPNAFNNLTIGQVFHDDIFKEDGTMKPMWEYLLHNPDTDLPVGSIADLEQIYSGLTLKLSGEFETLLNNISKNTEVATMRELYNHGLLDVTDPSIFDKKIIGDTKCLGDYTYKEFLDKIAASGILVD